MACAITICQIQPNDFTPEICASFEAHILPNDNPIAFTALINSIPVGWITSFAFIGAKESLVKCLQVYPEAQNKGVGTALMNHLINHLRGLGIQFLHFQYKTNEKSTQFIEKLLIKTNWQPSELLFRRYYLDHKTFHPEWYFSPFPVLPNECSLLPFSEILPEELDQIKSWSEQNPEIYRPFDPKFPIDELTSLALRHEGKIAGWIVNHRLNPKLLRYSSFYVIPQIRGLGPAFSMLRESIRLHLKNEIDVEGSMEINFKLAKGSWLRFIQTRLAPYASRTEDTNYTWTKINHSASEIIRDYDFK